jgi:hypothetical protein
MLFVGEVIQTICGPFRSLDNPLPAFGHFAGDRKLRDSTLGHGWTLLGMAVGIGGLSSVSVPEVWGQGEEDEVRFEVPSWTGRLGLVVARALARRPWDHRTEGFRPSRVGLWLASLPNSWVLVVGSTIRIHSELHSTRHCGLRTPLGRCGNNLASVSRPLPWSVYYTWSGSSPFRFFDYSTPLFV